jgi:large subunit ribosomal protein L9
MDVILLQDVEKLGLQGDVVGVKRGYARNYLLPRRLAEVATAGRVAEIRRVDAARAQHEARSAEQAQEIAGLLGRTVLRFEVKAGPTGSLFGSVTASNVAEELWRTRKVRVDKRKIEIEAIKKVGRYFVPVHVYEGVVAEVKTLVVPEGGDLTEEELEALTAQEEAAARDAEAEAAAAAAAAAAARAAEEAVAESVAERTAAGEAAPGEADTQA